MGLVLYPLLPSVTQCSFVHSPQDLRHFLLQFADSSAGNRTNMTTTTVLILLLRGILAIKQANRAAALPTLEARQTLQSSIPIMNTRSLQSSMTTMNTNVSQSGMPVIDTGAFNQCFSNNWYTRDGSPCYPATYDFEICFKHNQTVMIAQDPSTIYMCVCLPWPEDGRTYVSISSHFATIMLTFTRMLNDTALYACNQAFLLYWAIH